MTQEALKLALEALITITDAIYVNSQQEADAVYKANDAVKAIKEALAQPEEAQSALSLFQSGFIDGREKGLKEALAQRTWVGLTKKEVHDLYDSDYVVFHQRIEAKLKERNT